jgi:two-component system NtrC family sensor kinase
VLRCATFPTGQLADDPVVAGFLGARRSTVTIDEVTEPTTPLRGRILVVDDDDTMGLLLRRMLGREHEVVVVQSAVGALALLATDAAFDVILSDVMLPGMSGTEMLAELNVKSPALAARVVFLTGGAFSAEARAALAVATTPILEKPFDRAKLRAVIDELVARRA